MWYQFPSASTLHLTRLELHGIVVLSKLSIVRTLIGTICIQVFNSRIRDTFTVFHGLLKKMAVCKYCCFNLNGSDDVRLAFLYSLCDVGHVALHLLVVLATIGCIISDWTTLQAHTIKDPLDEAIHDITATNSVEDWGGLDVSKMFDFNEKNFWHTNYYKKGVLPFDVTLNLNGIAKLDKIHYVPASERETNGQIQKGKFAISNDGINWTETGSFDWKNEDAVKEYQFKGNPEAQYIKMTVEEAKGGQGSGTEMYVFKMPGSKIEKAGDINHDGRIDENDFTSYLNYCGLRKGDKDFEGYVSKGDVNGNGLIDAYDISVVATQLKSGVSSKQVPVVSGNISLIADKKMYKAGETITLTVKGKDLVSLNALSFTLPYSASEYEFIGVDVKDMGKMENITKDRLHSDGSKVLYPTFVNMGEQPAVEGTHDLFTIKLKAKKACKPAFKLNQLMMVDKFLRVKSEK